ncbi:unnamed protein product [Tuber aestivum]|uniref:Granulins domain-containing protein n=1 Tax=Tuber aestivum TaxID=59557 RepID=A0A292PMD9_9PEZI|nr:unnamed protein product [Tuber aestivum]
MLLKKLPALTLFLTLTHAAAFSNPLPPPGTGELGKRDCVANGCLCNPDRGTGDFCGYCQPLQVDCPNEAICYTSLYHCGDGGRCCTYGQVAECVSGQRPC